MNFKELSKIQDAVRLQDLAGNQDFKIFEDNLKQALLSKGLTLEEIDALITSALANEDNSVHVKRLESLMEKHGDSPRHYVSALANLSGEKFNQRIAEWIPILKDKGYTESLAALEKAYPSAFGKELNDAELKELFLRTANDAEKRQKTQKQWIPSEKKHQNVKMGTAYCRAKVNGVDCNFDITYWNYQGDIKYFTYIKTIKSNRWKSAGEFNTPEEAAEKLCDLVNEITK